MEQKVEVRRVSSLHIDRLDKVGLHARLLMVLIVQMLFCVAHMWVRGLRHRLVSTGLAAFGTTPEYLVRKQSAQGTDRKKAHPIQFSDGFMNSKEKSSEHTTSSGPQPEPSTVPLTIVI